METIINKILEFVEPEEEITPKSTLKGDCGLTSFDTVCLAEALCKEYGKNVDEINVRTCHTVQDLADLFLD
ncbi:MAG: acyl carrier protein [Clostridia bacterium]|jgi:acyl carrier protein|nr:acyl carrier protein [Clostridia bacterium]